MLARAALHPIPVVASALVYEMGALIARCANEIEDADSLIDGWAETMKLQVRRFGVGVQHP